MLFRSHYESSPRVSGDSHPPADSFSAIGSVVDLEDADIRVRTPDRADRRLGVDIHRRSMSGPPEGGEVGRFGVGRANGEQLRFRGGVGTVEPGRSLISMAQMRARPSITLLKST